MTDTRNDPQPKPSNWVDEEFAGEHGTTASSSSVKEEKAPDFRPQNAHEVAEKVVEEASDDPGVIGKAKKALEEVDRQVAAEYEKRDDRKAPEEIREQGADQKTTGARAPDHSGTSTPEVAGAAVEAETERSDGVIKNPSR